MKEYPDDSPEPYTIEQLADIANSLGLRRNIKHEAVRRVVGIARALESQQQPAQPGFIKWQAEAAAKAAELETELSKTYKRYPFLGSAAAARARAAFQTSLYEGNKGKARPGRKPPNHIITALIQLYAIWYDVTGKRDAGKENLIRAALGPFGYRRPRLRQPSQAGAEDS
jgi:hypothetical protein